MYYHEYLKGLDELDRLKPPFVKIMEFSGVSLLMWTVVLWKEHLLENTSPTETLVLWLINRTHQSHNSSTHNDFT